MTSILDIRIDEEFQSLLQPLSEEESAALSASIKQIGFTDPLIVWKDHNLIVDGHNRYRMWQNELKGDNSCAPSIVEMDFVDRDQVKRFIFERQLARRNLNNAQRIKLALKLKPQVEAKAKQNQARGQVLSKSSKPIRTRKEIAEMAGVSEQTLERAETVLDSGNETVVEAMLNGEISIGAAHRQVKQSKNCHDNGSQNEPVDVSDPELPSTFAGDPSPGESFNPDEFDASMHIKCADYPPHLREIIPGVVIADQFKRKLRKLKKELLAYGGTRAGSYLDTAEVERFCDSLISGVNQSTYEAICPECKFEPLKTCRRCAGRGFIAHANMRTLTSIQMAWLAKQPHQGRYR